METILGLCHVRGGGTRDEALSSSAWEATLQWDTEQYRAMSENSPRALTLPFKYNKDCSNLPVLVLDLKRSLGTKQINYNYPPPRLKS